MDEPDPGASHDSTGDTGFDPDDPTTKYTNRELSWLQFNSRVLAQAEDPTLPLLERLKFCAIYASNLDEFYMVRVAGLKDQVAAGVTATPPDGLTPLRQVREIQRVVQDQLVRLEDVAFDDILPTLAEHGVVVVDWRDLDQDECKQATGEFEDRVFPVLTPLAVDPGHPFPYISTLSLNLAVSVIEPETRRRRFARVKVPPALPRFIELPSGRNVPIEQVIAAHLDQLFPGMEVAGAWPFRVTRNADLTLDDEDADDLLEAVEIELRRRRFGRSIRLEIDDTMPTETRRLLLRELDLDDADVLSCRGLLDPTGFWQIVGSGRPDLSQPNFRGVTPAQLDDTESSADFFARLREDDVLVHHPYDSFSRSVSEFVRQASLDPRVLAIKLTLYRTSGDSPVVESLIRAAESGKQVAALVELKARFDESNNIGWARRLEEAGVHVVYGLVGLKTHCKTTLVVRDDPDGLRQYCHIGTGNYNPKTARIYEDIGILTSREDIGEDLTQLFNFLTGFGRNVDYQRLLVAPRSLRPRLLELIAGEAARGAGGRIMFKMNSLVDAEVIDSLYEASQAGVKVDLFIRGICCLRPGVAGLSENIRVRSLVGRYLEHSRIFYFEHGESGPNDQTEPGLYFGSADLMPRNLDRRVEVLVRLINPEIKRRLIEIFAINDADNTLAWELGPDGHYRRLPGGTVSAHDTFEALATARTVRADRDETPRNRPMPPPLEAHERADIEVRAAGCVVWRSGLAGPEVLVVHRPRYNDWSFPKGKLDVGEEWLDGAVREVGEETGLSGSIGAELDPVRYLDRKGRNKIVRYWLMQAEHGVFEPNDEVDEIEWLDIAGAADRLSYERDAELLAQAASRIQEI